MTEFAPVEQELAELTRQLQQSFQVLADLAQVQRQFEQLAQTHQGFREAIEHNQAVLSEFSYLKRQVQDQIDDRLNKLESNFQMQLEDMNRQIFQLQTSLGLSYDAAGNPISIAAQYQALSTDLTQQLHLFKSEIDARFATATQATQHQSETSRLSVEAAEASLTAQLKTSVEQINQMTASASHVGKLEAALRSTRTSLRDAENQLGSMRNWLLVVTAGTLVALGLSLPPSFLNPQTTSSFPLLERSQP